MLRFVVESVAGGHECVQCAATMDTVLRGRALQASFRPVADFSRCEIFGYIAAVQAPAVFLAGSFDRLNEIALRQGVLHEFGRACAEAAIRRFVDSGASGSLFLPLPQGAVEAAGGALGDTVRTVAADNRLPPERLVVVVPRLDANKYDAGIDFAKQLAAGGIGIATGNVGCVLDESLLWSAVTLDFGIVDSGLFDGVDLGAAPESAWIELLAAEMARGRRIVADGIRNKHDFDLVKKFGVAYGAGEFFGRAKAVPTRLMAAAAHKAVATHSGCGGSTASLRGGVLERLLVKLAPVAAATMADEVFFLFERKPDLLAVAVVEDGVPRGLISRYEMVDNMARPFRHELYGRKPCARFMDAKPLVVDIGVTLEELAEIVVGTDPRHLISGFIITECGRYLGMGSVQDLVREVTAMQMEAAKYANPLTQLPGNVPINQHIDNLLAAGESCCVAYCDLDHFKPFNDVYGYAKGDEVIKLTAHLLGEACAPGIDFLGHIGGDDFVLVLRSEDWEARCNAVLERFGTEILTFFSQDDAERGGYVTENRKGQMEFHRLTSLSIGAVDVVRGLFQNHLQVSNVAAEVKKRAKAIAGNSLYINRRIYDGEAAARQGEAQGCERRSAA